MSSSINHSLYSQAVSYHGIQGLYPSFHTAAAMLRMAKPELFQLCASNTNNAQESLEDFYRLINEVERDLLTSKSRPTTATAPFIVLVEGLDGSGKSSLVESLSKHLPNASAWSTPTTSVTAVVRDTFDRMGGAIARAFYMASNYILVKDIDQHFKNAVDAENHVYLVDRWYTSTCAYSIAWKNTTGTPKESIDVLEDTLFQWPCDLMTPQLLLLLEVDHETRKARVQNRNATSNHNPWDERLNQDEHLGKRIMSCMKRVVGPQEQVILNANQTQVEVLENALNIVMDRVAKRQYTTTTTCHPKDDDALSFFRANLTTKPVTLVLTGTHCAGKATLGRKVANIMGWSFDQELGDILRDAQLVAGGHRIGNGSDGEAEQYGVSWDDFILREEIKRDVSQPQGSRVVETWHVGNVGWALLRLENKNDSCTSSSLKDRLEIVETAKKAIMNHQKVATVLLVHLHVPLETCLSRRKVAANSNRVPMKDEQTECQELHRALDGAIVELLQNEYSDLNLPTLIIDNSQDGDAAIDVAARNIVRFIHDYIWRSS